MKNGKKLAQNHVLATTWGFESLPGHAPSLKLRCTSALGGTSTFAKATADKRTFYD